MSEIVITTLAERPDIVDGLRDFWNVWPEFMLHDPVAGALLGAVPAEFPDQCLVATADGELVAQRSKPRGTPRCTRPSARTGRPTPTCR
jgi:hypothetical protein